MLSFSLCQNSPAGLGFNLHLISLANPFPLLARISPGISKETVNYVGYSFIYSLIQYLKKKKKNPNPKKRNKTTLCSCCAATSVRGFLNSLANINQLSLIMSLCRREELSIPQLGKLRCKEAKTSWVHSTSILPWPGWFLPGALTCSNSFISYPLLSDCSFSSHSVWWLCKLWLQKHLPTPSPPSHPQSVLHRPATELHEYFILLVRSFQRE